MAVIAAVDRLDAAGAAAGGRAGAAPPQAPSYAQVQKVLEQRCYMCHGAQVQMKNVRLDTPDRLEAARAGGLPAGGGDASSCR